MARAATKALGAVGFAMVLALAVVAPAGAVPASGTQEEEPPDNGPIGPVEDDPSLVVEGPVESLVLVGDVTATTTAGGGIDGWVRVTNIGTDDLVRAALTIDSDVDETLVDVTVPPGWTCRDVALVAGQDLFCDASSFPAGASATFTFAAVASDQLVAGDRVATTITANAELPVQEVQPLIALTTLIVDPSAPAPVAVLPRFTG